METRSKEEDRNDVRLIVEEKKKMIKDKRK